MHNQVRVRENASNDTNTRGVPTHHSTVLHWDKERRHGW